MAKELSKYAHPDYIARLPDYIMIRDCNEGERTIKDAGVTYLPQLSGQSTQDYDNYRRRALFFPITGKTASTMVGMVTTKPPKTTYPAGLEKYFKDTSLEQQFTETYVSAISEIILMGRYGILIDAPQDEGDPVLVPYIAENIVNWAVDRQGNLTMILLQECESVPIADSPFERKYVKRFRHCFLNDGIYTVETLDEDLKATSGYIQPVFSGETINFIPFTIFTPTGLHYTVDKPPMLDIATINISHYMSSADLEWGRHLTGLPTPVVSGVDSSSVLKVGGTAAWVLPDVGAKAYYMEFLGQGLGSLEKAMTDKVGLMASVSARLIDNSTRGSESAETVRLRYMSESASLIHILNNTESALTYMYNMLALLTKNVGDVVIKFSREIIGMGIALSDLKNLFEGYYQGALSKEDLLYNLRRLDAVDPNRTDEEILAGMKDPAPPAAPQPAPKPSPAPAA